MRPVNDPEERVETPPQRLYFVYRTGSKLPLLSGWRDEQAALRYARDYGAECVIGVDVTYLAHAPFEDAED